MINSRYNSPGIARITSIFILVSAIIVPGKAQSPVPEGAVLEHLESGFQLCEGPFWHPDGYLLFSDVWSSIIYSWSEENGLATFLSPSGQANGITMDLEGRLIIAQHRARQVGRIEEDGTITPLATHYDGKRFHSPNDLTVKSDGAIFFTDPPWGGNPSEMNFHGVYRIPPNGGDPQLLAGDITYPNGIAFSPDESRLYVDDSNGKNIFVFDVIDDTALANKRVFANLGGTQGADGIKVDGTGNIWIAGSVGVAVYSPDGDRIGSITVPGTVTNLTFGGVNGKMLYICGFNDLYRMDLTGQTGVDTKFDEQPETIGLNQNYPNPFNPSTLIRFDLPKELHVRLSIYNMSGQVVDVLLDRRMDAGSHLKEWDGSAHSSGVYFYELAADGRRMIQKMNLMK
ncbi:MAG TPA: T9SS type A sorting domain-containing protein [bacterium]|nr:T9SS type A sorting domain-containing protein [bacterium]